MAILVGIAAVPAITRDRSCHNPMRDGRTSIHSEVNVEVAIGEPEWPALIAEFAAFRNERHWSLRTTLSPPSDFYRQIDVSVCDEADSVLSAQAVKANSPDIPNVTRIGVMQPQGGLSWQSPGAALITRIERRFPGKVRFVGPGGETIARPAWLPASEKAGDAYGNHR